MNLHDAGVPHRRCVAADAPQHLKRECPLPHGVVAVRNLDQHGNKDLALHQLWDAAGSTDPSLLCESPETRARSITGRRPSTDQQCVEVLDQHVHYAEEAGRLAERDAVAECADHERADAVLQQHVRKLVLCAGAPQGNPCST